jgi:hypothetical protein
MGDIEKIKNPKGYLTISILWLSFIAWIAVVAQNETCTISGETIKYHDLPHGRFYVGIFVLCTFIEAALLIGYVYMNDALQALSICGCPWNLTELIFTAGVAFMMLLTDCLFADGIADHKTIDGCNINYKGWEFGTACGFFAMFAMLAKTYVLFSSFAPGSGGGGTGEYSNLDGEQSSLSKAKTDDEVTVSV